MQNVPVDPVVRLDRGAECYALPDGVNRGGFRLGDEGQREPAALAHDDHDLALAGLVLKAAVAPIFVADLRLT